MSISDELMWRYIELLSFEPAEKIRSWKSETDAGRNPKEIKILFAKEIVARFHSADAARRAEEDFESRFGRGELPEEIPEKIVNIPKGEKGISAVKALKEAGLAPSTSEAARVIEQGGVRVNGEKLGDRNTQFTRGEPLLIQVGKRKIARVTIK